MAVSDLTNTTWVLNTTFTTAVSGWSFSDEGAYSDELYINFTSNNENFDILYMQDDDGSGGAQIEYILYEPYTSRKYWGIRSGIVQEYQTITITGGTDATNASLITWLEANATQIPTATPKETFETNISALNDVLNEKAGTTGQHTIAQMVDVAESIQTGVTPTGNINITSTAQTDVTNYATAQVVDANLVASNIKKDVSILGITGTYEGGSSSISRISVAKLYLTQNGQSASYRFGVQVSGLSTMKSYGSRHQPEGYSDNNCWFQYEDGSFLTGALVIEKSVYEDFHSSVYRVTIDSDGTYYFESSAFTQGSFYIRFLDTNGNRVFLSKPGYDIAANDSGEMILFSSGTPSSGRHWSLAVRECKVNSNTLFGEDATKPYMWLGSFTTVNLPVGQSPSFTLLSCYMD